MVWLPETLGDSGWQVGLSKTRSFGPSLGRSGSAIHGSARFWTALPASRP